MERILELKPEINAFSDEELLNNFNSEPPIYGKFNYYPVFATRLEKFKDLIFHEAISEKNTKIIFRTIKPSWFIAVAMLDYCDNKIICIEFVNHLKKFWESNDFNSFIHYISKEERFYKYFQ